MKGKGTFFCGFNGMITFSFFLVFDIALHFSEIGTLIMRSKVYHYLFVITRHFLLVLLYAPFHYHIHEVIYFSFSVDYCPSWVFLKRRIFEYFPPFLWIFGFIPLLRMTKNLLKASMLSKWSRFLLFGASLYYYRIASIFYSDWISIAFSILLTEGMSIGGFSFSFFNSTVIFCLILSNLLFWKSSKSFL